MGFNEAVPFEIHEGRACTFSTGLFHESVNGAVFDLVVRRNTPGGE